MSSVVWMEKSFYHVTKNIDVMSQRSVPVVVGGDWPPPWHAGCYKEVALHAGPTREHQCHAVREVWPVGLYLGWCSFVKYCTVSFCVWTFSALFVNFVRVDVHVCLFKCVLFVFRYFRIAVFVNLIHNGFMVNYGLYLL